MVEVGPCVADAERTESRGALAPQLRRPDQASAGKDAGSSCCGRIFDYQAV